MDHPIAGPHVGLCHGGVIDLDGLALDADGQGPALEGGQRVVRGQIGGQEDTRDGMVGEHAAQGVGIGEQGVQHTSGQQGKGVVGRREDCQLRVAAERVDQIGGHDGRDQGAETLVRLGDLHDAGQDRLTASAPRAARGLAARAARGLATRAARGLAARSAGVGAARGLTPRPRVGGRLVRCTSAVAGAAGHHEPRAEHGSPKLQPSSPDESLRSHFDPPV